MNKFNNLFNSLLKEEEQHSIPELLTAKGFCYHGKKASNCVGPQMYTDHKKINIIYGLWNSNNSVKATIGLDKETSLIMELASFSPKYHP